MEAQAVNRDVGDFGGACLALRRLTFPVSPAVLRLCLAPATLDFESKPAVFWNHFLGAADR